MGLNTHRTSITEGLRTRRSDGKKPTSPALKYYVRMI